MSEEEIPEGENENNEDGSDFFEDIMPKKGFETTIGCYDLEVKEEIVCRHLLRYNLIEMIAMYNKETETKIGVERKDITDIINDAKEIERYIMKDYIKPEKPINNG